MLRAPAIHSACNHTSGPKHICDQVGQAIDANQLQLIGLGQCMEALRDKRTVFQVHFHLQHSPETAMLFSPFGCTNPCCILLAVYRTNSDTINHAVVKMLHRISVDFKMAQALLVAGRYTVILTSRSKQRYIFMWSIKYTVSTVMASSRGA